MSGRTAVMSVLAAADREELITSDIAAEALGFPRFELLGDARQRGLEVVPAEGRWLMSAREVVRVYIAPLGSSEDRKRLGSGGGVYFVSCGQFVKIGVTQSLECRMDVLRLHNPFDLEVLCFLPTASVLAAYKMEATLHRKFSVHRHRGEWFKRVPEIDGFITAELVRQRTTTGDDR